jgi:aldehyde dehydrogenase (NAD+)
VALSAGNPCILRLSAAIPATSELLLELIPKYFEPEALAAVSGDREIVSELLQLPFDFIFLTGSVSAGKAVMKAAAEHLTPVVSHSTAKRWFDVMVSKEVLLAGPARDTYSLTA